MEELGNITQFATIWGPGFVILVGFFLLLRRLIDRSFSVGGELMKGAREDFKEFVGAQTEQAGAMSEMAITLKGRNESDRDEHREILMCIKLQQGHLLELQKSIEALQKIYVEQVRFTPDRVSGATRKGDQDGCTL